MSVTCKICGHKGEFTKEQLDDYFFWWHIPCSICKASDLEPYDHRKGISVPAKVKKPTKSRTSKEPSAKSLADMPEVSFERAKVQRFNAPASKPEESRVDDLANALYDLAARMRSAANWLTDYTNGNSDAERAAQGVYTNVAAEIEGALLNAGFEKPEPSGRR